MNKISFDNWKNSMSFLLDDEFDRSFLGSIDLLTKFMNSSCSEFSSYQTLADFLMHDSKDFSAEIRLKSFISLIGLSEERLKRVATLVRSAFFKEEFGSEWSVKQISNKIYSNEFFRKLLLTFFLNGRNSQIGEKMPQYYMRNFKLLNADFMMNLADYGYVSRILNDNEIQGRYSNKVGAHVENLIVKRLDEYQRDANQEFKYELQKELPLLNKNIDFLIPSVDAPLILIESSYNITTGSSQSKRADQLVDMYTTLVKHNANQKFNKIIMMNYCDGLGWVGRQRDLQRIHDASDFVFNQANLDVLDKVLDIYCN